MPGAAADTAVVMDVSDGNTTYFEFNTLLTANATALEIDCAGTCTRTDYIEYKNNIFLGFRNDAKDGYPRGGSGDYSNPIYLSVPGLFRNSGSSFDHNLTYHYKSNWSCPHSSLDETSGRCVDPRLTNETWPLYGHNNVQPLAGNPAIDAGIVTSGITTDYNGGARPNPPSIGAMEPEIRVMGKKK